MTHAYIVVLIGSLRNHSYFRKAEWQIGPMQVYPHYINKGKLVKPGLVILGYPRSGPHLLWLLGSLQIKPIKVPFTVIHIEMFC